MNRQHIKVNGINDRLLDFKVLTARPMAFSLLEFEVFVSDLPAGINVYKESDVDVSLRLVSSGGKTIVTSGFFFQEYSFKENRLISHTENPSSFRMRVSPCEAGEWSFELTLKIRGESVDSLKGSVSVLPSIKGSRLLRVEPNRKQTFVTASGDDIVFCGRNLCWSMPASEKDIFADYVISNMKKLAENGGNMFRIWDFIECGSYIKKGVHDMNQAASAMWDRVFEAADELEVYISFVCSAHGEVSSRVDACFDRSPWHKNQGGYIEKAEDFFSDSETISAYKTYLRYIVSRFGYCEHIFFELFNEIDHTDALIEGRLSEVKAWLFEMASYIRGIDPYGHLVTNSTGALSVVPALYDDFDFIYYHIYNYYAMNQLSEVQRAAHIAYNLPVVLGEYGFDYVTEHMLENRFFSEDFLEVHQGNWAGIMGCGAATAMPWWWYELPDGYDSYKCYKVISDFAKKVPWSRADLLPVSDETVNLSNRRIGVMGYIGSDCAYMWLFDNNYLTMCRDMAEFENEDLSFALENGEYLAEWIDTRSGGIIKDEKIRVLDGQFTLDMPTWSKDVALRIQKI